MHYFSDLACIFGIYFHQISKLPCLLSFVKVSFVRFLHLNHFNLDRPLCSNWKRKADSFTNIYLSSLIVIYSCFCGYNALTCCTQEAVLLFLSCLADINNAEEALIVGCEDVPLESMLDGCHSGCCHTEHSRYLLLRT